MSVIRVGSPRGRRICFVDTIEHNNIDGIVDSLATFIISVASNYSQVMIIFCQFFYE